MIIAVRPQPTGYLELEPVGYQDREVVKELNKYDGTCTAYLTDSQDIESFISTLTWNERTDINQGWRIDIDMDFHTFRHMVGGQCD